MKGKVRVRFAPSPTGPLHIGGVRTALFNYLFAKKHGGDFLLRIEDTDQTRLVEEAEDYINESLNWLGLVPDEGVREGGEFGPYKQSERSEIYRRYADELVNNHWAYYAFDTPEELEKLRNDYEQEKRTFSYNQHNRLQMRNSLSLTEQQTSELIAAGTPFVLRFKMPENVEVSQEDLIRGTVRFNTSTLDDKVIFKSDGLPTYHLANIVDDHLMKITHVIRGEEWLPSLPLHIMLYRAFGWEDECPAFAHLPLILKPSGKGKLSKRDGDKEGFPVFPLRWEAPDGELAAGYREEGYFPEAVINILAMLGWNPGTEQELFSLSELVKAFSLDRVNKAGARFDPEKAKWYNQQYLQNKSTEELTLLFLEELKLKGITAEKWFAGKVVESVKERAVFVKDIWEQGSYFFEAPEVYDENTVRKFWKEDTARIVTDCLRILEAEEDFTSALLEEKIKAYVTGHDLGFGKVMNPLRIAVVGEAKGPHLFDIFEMLGKAETLLRIENALERIR
ncbi:MAG: glutamate--tRNA ligase [Bacteroidales bacterium]|nr:glutamate--tRNA ligase [Bacteroidales bacterium]